MKIEVEKYEVEMTQEHHLALHAADNMLDALNALFGDSPERTEALAQIRDLKRRFATKRAEATASRHVDTLSEVH